MLMVGTSLFFLAIAGLIPFAEWRLFKGTRTRDYSTENQQRIDSSAPARLPKRYVRQLILLLLGAAAFCAAWLALLASVLIAPWEILWPSAIVLVFSGVFGLAASIGLFFGAHQQRIIVLMVCIGGLVGFVIVFVVWVHSWSTGG